MKHTVGMVGIISLLAISGCDSDAWNDQCFFKLTIPQEEVATLGPGRLSQAFDPQFGQYQADPTSPPPLVESNEMVFADRCDFLGSDNYIDQLFDEREGTYLLVQIRRDEYLGYYNSMGGQLD